MSNWSDDTLGGGAARSGGMGYRDGFGMTSMDRWMPPSDESVGRGEEESVSLVNAGAVRRRIEPRVPPSQRELNQRPEALSRPMSFTCPACGVVLVIREPENYDGSAAPCPQCAVQILPPRIVYSTVSFDLHPLPGLSDRGLARSPRALHRFDRRGRLSWQATGSVLSAQ